MAIQEIQVIYLHVKSTKDSEVKFLSKRLLLMKILPKYGQSMIRVQRKSDVPWSVYHQSVAQQMFSSFKLMICVKKDIV